MGKRAREPERGADLPAPATQEPIVASPEGSAEDPSVDRRLEHAGEEWVARAIGWTRSGRWPDAGSPILLVAFARAREPSRFLHESLIVGESLAEVSTDDLLDGFARSKPYGKPAAPGR